MEDEAKSYAEDQEKVSIDVSETYDQTNVTQAISESISLPEITDISDQSKQQKTTKNKLRMNLAMNIAKKFPKGISEEVCKIIQYYEYHQTANMQKIHELTSENAQLRKKIREDETEDKQNSHLSYNSKLRKEEEKDERIHNLEEASLQKDKKILQLNQETTKLLNKVKKYKKRVYELELQAPPSTLQHDI